MAVLRDVERQADPDPREGRHLEAAGDRLEAADADHGEGARRQDRSLRPDVQADEPRSDEEVSDRQPHLSRAADRQRRRPHLRRRARRHAGARRARLRRRRDRRHGHAVALEEVPRGLLRQHGRQHAARPGRGDEAAGGSAIRGSTSTAPASTGHSGGGYATADAMFRYPDFFKVGISESGNHDNRDYEDDWAEKWQGLLEKKPDGTTNYDNQANQNAREEPEGQPAARARHDGQQRAAEQHAAGGRRADQGEQGFRSADAAQPAHGYGSMSNYMMRRRWDYFVQIPAGRRAAEGVPSSSRRRLRAVEGRPAEIEKGRRGLKPLAHVWRLIP